MRVVAILLLVSAAAFAQRGGMRSGSISPSRSSGFGNILFPGTGGPPGRHAPVSRGVPPGSFADRLGSTVSGFPPYTGSSRSGHRRAIVVPYPVYGYGYGGYLGYSGYGYGYDQQPQQNVIVLQQQPSTTPQVVINQDFSPDPPARPVVREYQTDPDGISIYEVPTPSRQAAASAPETKTFLIALKDQTIYAATSVWVEGNTLHYKNLQGVHNQVSGDLIDRELTQRLNRERSAEVSLP